ncbi:MAG: ABC transporter permease subunit, partial [bacterium]|nr:ABC transporter permease subunit [bacterium]
SLKVSAVATAACLIPGVGLGVWLGRTRSGLRVAVEAVVTLPLVMPPVVTGLCLLQVFLALKLPLAFTWWGAAMASAVVALPLWVRTVRTAVEAMDPRLLPVAATLGASATRRFWTITLPVCWKGMAGGMVLFWARAISEFGATIVVASNTPGRTQTIPLAIYSKIESPTPHAIWPLVGAAIALSITAVVLSELLIRNKRMRRRGRRAQAAHS